MVLWLRGYEERKGQINSNPNSNHNSSNYSNYKEPKEPREPSQTFVSKKYDFQSGDWSQLNDIMIPSLGMPIKNAISALKKSWKMYKHNLAEGEPTDQISLRLLKLQKALGLREAEFLKDELLSMGYTVQEIEDGEGDDQDEWDAETDSEWSDEDRELLAEEIREAKESENDVWAEEEESESQETEWTDLDQRMFQERLDAEREAPW